MFTQTENRIATEPAQPAVVAQSPATSSRVPLTRDELEKVNPYTATPEEIEELNARLNADTVTVPRLILENWISKSMAYDDIMRDFINPHVAVMYFVDVDEAAEMLGTDTKTVWGYWFSNKLKAFHKLDGDDTSKLWFSRRDVESLKNELEAGK